MSQSSEARVGWAFPLFLQLNQEVAVLGGSWDSDRGSWGSMEGRRGLANGFRWIPVVSVPQLTEGALPLQIVQSWTATKRHISKARERDSRKGREDHSP